MTGSNVGTLAVMYDSAAAVTATEIFAALRGRYRLLFLTDASVPRTTLTMLARLGETVESLAAAADVCRELRQRGEICGVVTFNDSLVIATAEIADILGLPSLTAGAARVIKDKYAFRQILHDAGLTEVDSHLLGTPADILDLPTGKEFVVKPRLGLGGADTFLVPTSISMRRVISETFDFGHREFVAEERILGRDTGLIGDYLSVESFMIGGECVRQFVTGKLPLAHPFREVGQFVVPPADPQETEAVLCLVRSALRAIGAGTGATHSEVKLTANGYELIEINGRVGGLIPELYSAAGSGSFVRAAADLARGDGTTAAALMDPASLTYQYAPIAPTSGCVLRAAAVGFERDKVEGLKTYKHHVDEGARLGPGLATKTLGVALGTAQSEEQMLVRVNELARSLVYEFEVDGQRCAFSAGELCR